MSRRILSGAAALFFVALASRADAVFDIIIDDSDMTVDYSLWGTGVLQTATGDNSYGGSYHYVTDWGGSGQASARVFYRMPLNIDFPAGEHLYNVYAWSPANNWNQWHAVNVAGDGTENFNQNISWAGQFGTNKQWLGFDPNKGINPTYGGRWVKLGPGPQTDTAANGGSAVHINASNGPEPYFYVEYQPWYEGTIAFDAIRIVQFPIPGDFDSDSDVDGADFVAWQTNFPKGSGATLAEGDADGDSDVDGADFVVWQTNFPYSPGPGNPGESPVPEPGSITLALAAAGLLGLLARNKIARCRFHR
jgi:hypothetical protein